jgi:nicotinate-nucleotide adenylyltransferase
MTQPPNSELDAAPLDLSACGLLVLFGGTFDPPHRAHVRLPRLAAHQVEADAVAFIPAAVSPFKRGRRTTAAHHRLAMLRLALQDCHDAQTPGPPCVIFTDELDRARAGEPSYTVDTLRGLRERLGPKPTLRLLIGADQLVSFDRWKEYEAIIELAEPLVMLRPPHDAQGALENLPPGFDPRRWRARLVDVPRVDVSSTELRQRLSADQDDPPAELIHPDVAAYAKEHGLYRSGWQG